MKRLTHYLFGLAAMAMLAATFANADVTYTYTGNPLVAFAGTYGCSGGVGECALSGTFTLPALLPANLNLALDGPGYDFTPLSLSFTDGVRVLNLSNAPYLHTFKVFVTDANSVPLNWDVALATGNYIPRYHIATANDIANSDCCIYDISYHYTDNGFLEYAYNGNGLEIAGDNYLGNPGTWTVSNGSVPEPSEIFPIAVGLVGVVWRTAKRHSNLL